MSEEKKSSKLVYFGLNGISYRIYFKSVANGVAKRGAAPGATLRKNRYFLRKKESKSGRETVIRLTAAQVEECRNLLPEDGGIELVKARCQWAEEGLAVNFAAGKWRRVIAPALAEVVSAS